MTYFSEIYRLFLGSIQSYELETLFVQDTDAAEEKLEIYLIKSIPEFSTCVKDLNNVDMQEKCFNEILDIDEKVILCDLMVEKWFEQTVNDILNIREVLGDTDYKISNKPQQLKASVDAMEIAREKVHHNMTQYSFKHNPPDDWGVLWNI